MRLYKILMVLSLTVMSQHLLAQSEGGLIVNVEAQKTLNKQWSIGLQGDMRTRNDFKTMDRWRVGLSTSYKLNKYLKADVGYLMMRTNFREIITYSNSGGYNHWTPSYWGTRHRVYAALTSSYKFKNNIKVALRERWQWTYRGEKELQRWDFDDTQWEDYSRDGNAKNLLRSRLTVSYEKKKALLSPYFSVESFNGWSIEKMRYVVGTELDLDKHQGLQIFYRHEHMSNTNSGEYNPHMNYVGIGYKVKF